MVPTCAHDLSSNFHINSYKQSQYNNKIIIINQTIFTLKLFIHLKNVQFILQVGKCTIKQFAYEYPVKIKTV